MVLHGLPLFPHLAPYRDFWETLHNPALAVQKPWSAHQGRTSLPPLRPAYVGATRTGGADAQGCRRTSTTRSTSLPSVRVVGAVAVALVSLVVGAAFGYFSRRAEHQRERRFDAFNKLLVAFINAAETGTTLLSVHFETGYPDELSNKVWTVEQIQAMIQAHADSWTAAAAARSEFETATANVEMVGSARTISFLPALHAWLDDVLYSGVPWGFVKTYPKAKLNPVDIMPMSRERVRSFIKNARRDLWGRRAAKELDVPSI